MNQPAVTQGKMLRCFPCLTKQHTMKVLIYCLHCDMDQHPIQQGVELFLVPSCYRNQDKLWPDEPLGSYTDFIYPTYKYPPFLVFGVVVKHGLLCLIKTFTIIVIVISTTLKVRPCLGA